MLNRDVKFRPHMLSKMVFRICVINLHHPMDVIELNHLNNSVIPLGVKLELSY